MVWYGIVVRQAKQNVRSGPGIPSFPSNKVSPRTPRDAVLPSGSVSVRRCCAATRPPRVVEAVARPRGTRCASAGNESSGIGGGDCGFSSDGDSGGAQGEQAQGEE